ncbi:predicted protein [Paecilomyces variotii No. 5]|uniref:F-box domain-containing protein n=1 Tax=Byssochlamys spectabilis (strain No. 5 / NBRC 109023) TaxID=1356009 RepID=V5G203_BYSSN|nr:predicted protein [Paecilomyces variotii No. 5]
MLSQLPVELIQQILHYADTPSYLQTAYTCRRLFEAAGGSRELVMHHLEETPGSTCLAGPLDTKELFLLLRQRASKLLYGAETRASRTLHIAEGRATDPRACAVTSSGNVNLALAFKGDGIVRTYFTRNGLLFPRKTLRPPYDQPGRIEILRVAFGVDNTVAVLHRFIPEIEANEDAMQHPFVRQALQSPPEPELYLVHYDTGSLEDKLTVYALTDREDYEALSLAMFNKYRFAISWQHVQDRTVHEVALYDAIPDPEAEQNSVACLRYMSTVIADEGGHVPANANPGRRGPASLHPRPWSAVSQLAFNDHDSQLLYYHTGCTLYDHYQSLDNGMVPAVSRLRHNYCWATLTPQMILNFSIGIPFYALHDTRDISANRPVCHWKYLAFGLGKDSPNQWIYPCILMAEARCRAVNCGHIVNLERGRRLVDWKVVARLRGYPEERVSMNSVGCIIAASPDGQRIAVANWKTVSVWSLQPEVLVEENSTGFYPDSWKLRDDLKIIDLDPIVLKLDAVCFKLSFTGREDELLAVTDRGLMYWDIGPTGTGARMTRSLDLDGRGGTWVQSDRLL